MFAAMNMVCDHARAVDQIEVRTTRVRVLYSRRYAVSRQKGKGIVRQSIYTCLPQKAIAEMVIRHVVATDLSIKNDVDVHL